MNMNEIETLILAGVDDRTIGMKYAQGYGRLLGFFWGVMERMSPEDQAETRKRLEEFAEYWSKKAEKVEESTT